MRYPRHCVIDLYGGIMKFSLLFPIDLFAFLSKQWVLLKHHLSDGPL